MDPHRKCLHLSGEIPEGFTEEVILSQLLLERCYALDRLSRKAGAAFLKAQTEAIRGIINSLQLTITEEDN